MERTDIDLTNLLRSAGLRATPQRIAICRFVSESTSHPTANEIYEHLIGQFPTTSLATIYNTLDVLVKMGLVNPLGSIGDDKVHFDGRVEPHINLVCTSCHSIFDFQSEVASSVESEIYERSSFSVAGSSVIYYGICPACKNKPEIQK